MIKVRGRKKEYIIQLVCWILVVLWIALMLWLSFQNGEQTSYLSLGIAEKITQWLPQIIERNSFDEVHSWIRKAAHVSEFVILGLFSQSAVCFSIRLRSKRQNAATIYVGVACTLIALLTEILKIYIPGRHMNLGEIALNIVSVWSGIGLAGILCKRCW